MNKSVVRLICMMAVAFIIWPSMGVLAQEEKAPTEKKNKHRISDPLALDYIKLAENKIYCPLDTGLKDFTVLQKLALKNVLRTFWFKAPNLVKAEFGDPSVKVEKKETAASRLFKNKMAKTTVPQIIAEREIFTMLGRPMSCLIPYGRFEIVKKDEKGVQLRYTVNVDNPKNLVWSNIDFFLNAEFHLVKIMEKMVADGRIEERRITMRPLKEDSPLLVRGKEDVIAGYAEKWQSRMSFKYNYELIDGFHLPTKVNITEMDTEKPFTTEFKNYKINKGIDDSVFKDVINQKK